MMRRGLRMASGKIKRGGSYYLPPVSIIFLSLLLIFNFVL